MVVARNKTSSDATTTQAHRHTVGTHVSEVAESKTVKPASVMVMPSVAMEGTASAPATVTAPVPSTLNTTSPPPSVAVMKLKSEAPALYLAQVFQHQPQQQ